MQNENMVTLIIDIIKAILLFLFRLLLLIPMILLAIIGAILGANGRSIEEAVVTCIVHPFKALGEAIRNISYAIKNYRNS